MWCEHHYPSFVVLRNSGGGQSNVAQGVTSDARSRIIQRQEGLRERKAAADLVRNPGRAIQAPQAAPAQEALPWQLFAVVAFVFAFIVGISYLVVWVVINYVA